MKPEPDALTTRWTLIRKLTQAECDEDSWTEFYHMYEHLVYAVARKLGLNHEESQDAVQDTMRSVCDNIRDFRPDPAHGSFKSWILKTARWRITDQLRRRGRIQPKDLTPADDSNRTATIQRIPDPGAVDLETVWEQAWHQELFEKALTRVKEQVSPDQFQIFDFYELRQMPAGKVARSLGVNIAQVYLARHRVLKAIAKETKALAKKLG